MQTETVTLGDKSYMLKEQAYRPGVLYREKLKENFSMLITAIQAAPNLDFKDTDSLAQIVKSVGISLIDSLDTIIELLFLFSSELEKDRQYVENNAVGSELVDAFIATLVLTFPFFHSERIKTLITTAQVLGSNPQSTEKNLALANGENGQTNSIENSPEHSTG